MRVAIIGAGAAGLASARHVSALGIECEVLEMAPELGGVWVYTDDIDKDCYGFPVYTAMYKGLRTNLPKEVMSFPDYPMLPDLERSYLTQPEVLQFLNDYADQFKLKPLIKFNRMVTEIRLEEDKWQITSIDKPTKRQIIDTYDYVMICNGHYNEPKIVKIPGQEKFKGQIEHSRNYRSPEPYRNQNVLVIGAGPSGLDVVLHVAEAAKSVILSHHTKAADRTKFQQSVLKKPDLVRIKNSEEVEFVDGTSSRIDTIIQCTGYKFSYPFLHESCGVIVEDNYIHPLYKHMINIDKPTMCFIGVPSYVCAFQMFDLQARFYCKYLTGALTLPPPEKMREETDEEMRKRWAGGWSKARAHHMGPFQDDYYVALATEAHLKPIKPAVPKLWHQVERDFYDDFLSFRDEKFKIVDDENFTKIN